MSDYQRPWWLVVNKPIGLVTTIEKESSHGEQLWKIRGEPLIQSLTWLIWGPMGAMVAVMLLTFLAIVGNMREQPWLIRGLFIMLYFLAPALAWGGTAVMLHFLAKKHLQSERQTERQTCFICLNQTKAELSYQTTTQPKMQSLPYQRIRQAKVTHAIEQQNENAVCLSLESDEGTIILLNEMLGSRTQKIALAEEIATCLDIYRRAVHLAPMGE